MRAHPKALVLVSMHILHLRNFLLAQNLQHRFFYCTVKLDFVYKFVFSVMSYVIGVYVRLCNLLYKTK